MAKKDAAPQTFKLFPCFHGSTFAEKILMHASYPPSQHSGLKIRKMVKIYVPIGAVHK